MSSAESGSEASNEDIEVENDSMEEISTAEQANPNPLDAVISTQENQENQEIKESKESKENDIDQQPAVVEEKEENEEKVEEKEPEQAPEPVIKPAVPVVPVQKVVKQPSIEYEEHPIVKIERHERDITAKIGDEVNLDEQFVISNHKSPDSIEKVPHIDTKILDVITKTCYPAESERAKVQNGEDWGHPRCLAVVPEKHIAIGTSKGVILIFNTDFTRIQKFGTSKERDFGAVVTLDIALKNDDVIAGYENGTMVLWSMTKNERLKTINPPDKSSLLCIRYFRDSEHFLLSTANGVVYHYHVQWIILQFRVDKKPLNLQEVDDKKGADKTLVRKETFESLPDGYFSILRLSKSLSKVRNANKNIIVALASMKEVLIISLAPFKVLYRHTRPVGISDIVTPCISWGTGAMPDNPNNTDPLLIYSWGKTIHMVQVMNIEPKRTAEEDIDDYWSDEEDDETVEKIKVAGYFSVKEDITILDWISSGTILACTALGEYLVLNSGGFKGAAVSSTIKVVNYNDVVVASLPFDEEIQYQVFNGTSKSGITQKNVVHYANTIRASTQDRQIYIMGKKRMLSLQHLEWQEYIDTLCRRNEWLDALSSCVSNYRNPSKTFASATTNPEERKKMVQRFSVDLAKRYVLSNQHPVKVYPVDPEQNKVWASVMVWVVDLMLATENYSALFSQIQRLMEDLYVREVFIESLEPFILRGRLKSLSNDAFKEIVKFYSEKGKLDVLQHLVINLSTKDIDMDNAIILCMQYNLLTALMYLCAHKDDPEGPDLLTPMASALGRYQRSVEENNPNQEYGLKFLWFLSMTLNARLFPDGLIPRKIWEHKVKDTIILLFEEYHLDLMLTIDAYISYEIFELCFQPELATLIGSFNDSSIKLIGNWNDDRPKGSKEAMNEQLKNDINRFIAAIQNTLQGQILGLIYYCSKKKEVYYNHLYYYLANVTVNRSCKVPYGVMEETLMYLLQHSYQAPPWKPKYTTKGLNEQRSELILGLLKELEPQNLEEITALADSDDLIDVKTYLIGLNKEFDKAFDLYLNQPTESGRMKVFNWLREIIPTISENSEAFEELKKMLIAKLHDLVAINGEKTRDIMLGLGNDVEMEVIQYLENKPHLQLDYVKEVLAKREGRDLIPDELLILHIKLLCLNEPKQVLKEIRAYNYPLDPCLNLCKEYKVKDAMAYLYERTGRLTEALDIKLDIFKEFLEKKITNVKEKGSFFSRGLDDKFEDISYACNEYTHLGTIEIPKMWLSTLDKILEFYQSCIAESKPKEDSADQVDYLQQAAAHEELSQTYIGYISNFIEEMSKSVPIEHILKRLKAFQGLKLGELKNAFLGMLKGHSYETNILAKAEGLLTLNNCRETEDIYAKSAEGIKIESSKVLLKEDDAEKAVVFLCGHVCNQNNVEEGVCPICMETEGWKVQNMVKVHTTKGTILTRGSKTSVTKPGASPVSTGGSARSPGKTSASVAIDAKPSRSEESGKSESRERSSRSLRKKKTISKWGKAEVRGDCIDKMDRFDDWRTADTFDWNKPDPRPKYGYKVPVYHKTN